MEKSGSAPKLDFEFHAYNDHVWVSGFGDSGKTKYVQYVLIPLFVANKLVVVVYDFNHNYDRLGLPVTAKLEYVAKYLANRQSIVYQSPTNSDEDFKKFCLIVSHYQKIIVVFEEIQEFARGKLSMPDHLSAIIKTGRNWKRSYVVITQRPQEVPTSLMTNTRHRFYFRQDTDSPSDKKWLDNAIGDKAEQLRQAPDYSYAYKERNKEAIIMPPIKPVWEGQKN